VVFSFQVTSEVIFSFQACKVAANLSLSRMSDIMTVTEGEWNEAVNGLMAFKLVRTTQRGRAMLPLDVTSDVSFKWVATGSLSQLFD